MDAKAKKRLARNLLGFAIVTGIQKAGKVFMSHEGIVDDDTDLMVRETTVCLRAIADVVEKEFNKEDSDAASVDRAIKAALQFHDTEEGIAC